MMKINDKFVSLIKEKIKKYANNTCPIDEGRVVSISDGIVIASGLDFVMLNELVEFANGTKGLVLNLEAQFVGIVALGQYNNIPENSVIKRTKKIISIPVGDELLGHVINPLGHFLDNEKIKLNHFLPIERLALGIMARQSINETFETGILAIDSMFPIGKGQRELIIGDRQTGKTTIAIDAIINQKGKNVKCIYVAIGQRESSIVQIYNLLQKFDALKYTTIISTNSFDLPALIYLAPYVGITIAEYWSSKGQDVLIVYDDLSKHAIAYRTISLLLHRPPGREAYPGDVFYLHSRLLERSGRFNQQNGNGSITALPIVETQMGDISTYIPTNLISITDGQLFLSTSMFNSGQCPAIDPNLSVSRVGSIAQKLCVKQVSNSLKLTLSQYYDLKAFSQFGSDLDKGTKDILNHGKKVMLMLKQNCNSPYSQIDETILLFAIKYHFIKWIPDNLFEQYKNELLFYFHKLKITKILMKTMEFNQQIFKEYFKEFKKFTLNFINKIPNYNFDLYGNSKELE